jgi:hypothetical protein
LLDAQGARRLGLDGAADQVAGSWSVSGAWLRRVEAARRRSASSMQSPPRQQAVDQGQHLAARIRCARAVAEVDQLVGELLDAKPPGQLGTSSPALATAWSSKVAASRSTSSSTS